MKQSSVIKCNRLQPNSTNSEQGHKGSPPDKIFKKKIREKENKLLKKFWVSNSWLQKIIKMINNKPGPGQSRKSDIGKMGPTLKFYCKYYRDKISV